MSDCRHRGGKNVSFQLCGLHPGEATRRLWGADVPGDF